MPDYARSNAIVPAMRHGVVLALIVPVLVVFALACGILVWKRAAGLALLERLVRRLAPLSVVGLAPLLIDKRLWLDRDVVFLLLAVAFGFGVRVSFLVAWRTAPLLPWLAALRKRASEGARAWLGRSRGVGRVDGALLTVIAGSCAYAAYFSKLTIENHRNFGSSAFDLGGEDNLMWNLVHGAPLFKSTPFMGPTGTHLGHHATFFAYVLAPIYLLAERPETLLVVQATLLGGAAIVLHLYARRHVPRWSAAIVSLLYLAYAPLHGANLYEYHYLPFGVFFVWLVLYAVEEKRPVLATVATLLAVSVREDVAFEIAVLGVFLLWTGIAVRSGALLAAVAGAYFLVMKLGVMPHYDQGAESFLNQYTGLLPSGERTFGSVLETITGNLPFTANLLVEHDKAVYLLQLFVPLLFAPLVRPLGLLLIVPGFLFTLLSTGYAPLFQISFHYTTYWVPFIFIGVILELERVGRARGASDSLGLERQRALLAGLVAASVVCSYLYGAFVPDEQLLAGFDPPRIHATEHDLRRRAELAALKLQIPSAASVSASEHLLPHISGRRDAYTLRFGVYDAEYLFFELPIGNDESESVTTRLRDGTFGVVDDEGDLVLAKRGFSTRKNADALSRIAP